jgi:hypothetical protein
MITKPRRERNTVYEIRVSLEDLRSQLVDLEALVNGAKDALDHLPYVPTPREGARYKDDDEAPYELEQRLSAGRLGSLVTAAAEAARQALITCDELVHRAYKRLSELDDGGGGEPGGSAGNGDPDTGPPGGNGDPRVGPDAKARMSRGGIALDVPPELAPFVSAPEGIDTEAAHGGCTLLSLRPPASA